MNSDSAKVPDNKSNWKSIDIYLFSNGQQASPPRKYHLVTDQLDWWNATLNHLAQAQYGSIHSMIDLYTIEGKKVETPMQLSHNTAYVAVIPTEYFIDAGYEKYLIKATRSWEKGQVRRNSNTAMVKPDEPDTGDKSNSDSKVIGTTHNKGGNGTTPNNKIVRDGSVTLKTIVASVVDNQVSTLLKPEPNTDKVMNNTTNLVKPSDKSNRTSMTPPRIVKKINSLICPSPPKSRKPSYKRRESVRINTVTTSDRSSLSDSINSKSTLKNKIYKPIQKKAFPEAALTKVEEVVNEIKSSSSLKVIKQRMSLTKASDIESVGQPTPTTPFILIPNVYNNSHMEKPSLSLDQKILSHNIDRQDAVHELFDECHHTNSNNYDKIAHKLESETPITVTSKNNTEILLAEKDSLSTLAFSTFTKPDTVSGINREGIVNLKLNIEIWNSPNEVTTFQNTMSKKESLININPEKGSQVDIVDKTDHEKLLHKIITNEMSVNEESHHKVIVVKGSCPDDSCADNTNHIFSVDNQNSKYLIFLPVLKLDEKCKRCECKEQNENVVSSQSNPAKNIPSCLSLHKEQNEKRVSHAEIISRNNSSEILKETNTIQDKNELTVVKRKSVAIKEDDNILSGMSKDCIEQPANVENQKPELLIVLENEPTGIMPTTANKFTQSEWCDTVWEAKLQNDGHYSFHMPTLENLRKYKL